VRARSIGEPRLVNAEMMMRIDEGPVRGDYRTRREAYAARSAAGPAGARIRAQLDDHRAQVRAFRRATFGRGTD